MACKVLFFDYRESEKVFFEEHKFGNFDRRIYRLT